MTAAFFLLPDTWHGSQHRFRTVGLLLVFCLTVGLAGCQKSAPNAPPPKPLTVQFVLPEMQRITEQEEFTGRTAATERVELRARVSGYLQQVDFAEGRLVQKGQVLFRIDERSFRAEEKRTQAAAAQFEARAKRLRAQEQRARSLLEKRAISQEEYEAAQYELTEAEASLEAAQAAHETATLNLDFTTITAPLTGLIGQRQVDVGNLVVQDQTLLATIVPVEKINVLFDMDERTVLRLRRMQQAGQLTAADNSAVRVRIALADSDEFTLDGVMDFQDNQVDPATGTQRMRAVVDNASGLLSPGLFVRLRYPIGEPRESLLIPEECLASDQGRPFVFVAVEQDGKEIAEARYIETGPLEGGRRVIRAGLTLEDRVITTGLQRLRRNAEIKAQPRPVPADSAVAPPASN